MRIIALLTLPTLVAALGPAHAACSGASCAMSNNRQAFVPKNQFVVTSKVISNDGSSLLAKGGGKLLSPANTNPNGLMRGVGR